MFEVVFVKLEKLLEFFILQLDSFWKFVKIFN